MLQIIVQVEFSSETNEMNMIKNGFKYAEIHDIPSFSQYYKYLLMFILFQGSTKV